ncbi:hypothetical protein I302_104043 [Kwoniella bestiolae CBS 10118]|uniref:Uncharacterized protein n=1 Tax=Kwoniella bestiolae CBS 10118 TaxID=1296100 RepID=A0A1B9GA50_9TREE|nr:hypothetical protein I302_02748 [Kwoniella bestiolae CBS 10118]OCF27898.1 hypothetical protein I302_02748 [Kwoniella bestiolae CBS 10118]
MGNMDDPADEPMPWVAIMNRTEVNADCTLDDGARAQWSIGEMNRILSNHAIAMAERGRSRFDKFVTSSSSQKADKEHIHSIFQDTLGSAEVDPRTTESKLKLFLTVFRATGPQNRYKYVFKFSTPGSHRPPNEVSFDQFNKRKIESSDEARFFRSFKTVLGALEILSEPEMSDFQGSYTTRDKFHVKIDSYKSDSFNQPYVGVVMKDGGARVQENTQPAI